MEEPIIDTFSYHYPPELLTVLGNAIPKLFRSKKELLLFFRGAGVKTTTLKPYEELLLRDRNSFKMYNVTRELLAELNEQGDQALSARREIIKRVVEFEEFENCYDNQRDAARGLVSQVREIIGRKDAFTRMRIEKDEERRKNIRQKDAALAAEQKRRASILRVKDELFSLISERDAHKRGKALEQVLNNMFECYGISIRKSFTINGENGEGITEQIDGLISFDGDMYLVEMKWWKKSIGVDEISHHLNRVSSRGGQVRGIFISYSNYTEPAIKECRDALNRGVVIVLVKLEEIVRLLENEDDLKSWLNTKVTAAIIDKKPLWI